MTVNIFTQYEVNGSVNSGGKVFIGAYGQEPTQNPINVYTDLELTQEVSGFGIDLDFNGLPIVGGQRVNLYVNESYSIQIKDEDNADLFVDWINVENPVDEVTTQNWLKDLVSLTPNLVLDNDGNGNWTINASSLGGGDVFQAGSNEFTESNSFLGEVGVWAYILDTATRPIDPLNSFNESFSMPDAGTYEYEFTTNLQNVVSADDFNIAITASRGSADFAGIFGHLSYSQNDGTIKDSSMVYTNATSPSLNLSPTPDSSDVTIFSKGEIVFEVSSGNNLQILIQKTLGGSANSVGFSLKLRKITDANVSLV